MDPRADLLKALEQALVVAAKHLVGMTTTEVTAGLTDATESCLLQLGFMVKRERPMASADVSGRVDVVARARDRGRLVVAIEIDRANKRRSIRKLEALGEMGTLPVWIRWGRNMPSRGSVRVPASVNVIELPLRYRRLSPHPGS